MRSQAALLRQARSALARPPVNPRGALLPTVRSSRKLRRKRSERVFTRPASSDASALPSDAGASSPPSFPPLPPSGASPEVPAEEAEKARRKTRVSTASKDSEPTPPLPNDLNVLWQPANDGTEPNASHLPPSEVLDEVLTNLHITLHPQTQHRAVYTTPLGPPSEPTLALYCPIEGGDYIIDETVRELARRTGSDVVVIDAVQLAAGEWGHFGKAASVVELPQNPLHFASSAPSSQRQANRAMAADEDDESDSPFAPSSMTLQILTPSPSRSRTFLSTNTRSTSATRAKAFFDAVINLTGSDSDASSEPGKPRIIYLRDFPTLAESSPAWYPSLLAAVRQRRQGPMNKPSSAVPNPMTIVFGMTPPLSGPSTPASGPMGQAIMSMLMSRQRPAMSSGGGFPVLRPGARPAYGEDETSEKAREQRLRTRLRHWERGDVSALQDEIPRLSTGPEGGEGGGAPGGGSGGVVLIGGPGGMSALPSVLGSALAGARAAGGRAPDSEGASPYFRTSVLVPSVRLVAQEQACRMARRREINELTMRMAVGASGGALNNLDPVPSAVPDNTDHHASEAGQEGVDSKAAAPKDAAEPTTAEKVWTEWGKRIEQWSTVRQIADRAVSVVVSEAGVARTGRGSLNATQVTWDAVYRAWVAHRSTRDVRKAWLQAATSGRVVREHDDEVDEDEDEEMEAEESDEVVERVKRDPDLDQHEQRLLGCIVNSSSMPTSFNQVHLPAHTIDSVRTIVSLPLLFPEAFQHGILKDHGMTGCLLFGPPGTGKTLLARALAKEAGCRMMAISPSDVMDMYVGEGEKLVKSVFSLARRLAPCVVFLDEIDALFGARTSGRETGGTIAHRGVLTEFMQEMDGLRSSKDDNVIVIGATNRPFDLDDAVLRRLPRRLLVDLPGEKEREAILKILLRDETLASEVDLTALARRTESFSGSDLKHLCVSAALDSVKEHVKVPWDHPSSPSATTSTTPVVESQAIDSGSSPSNPAEVALVADAAPSEVDTPLASDASVTPAVEATLPATEDAAASSSILEDAEPNTKKEEDPAPHPRVLQPQNFAKALTEITPSSSESLGTLADLRKWNDEFGEGRKDKKRVQVWGKGRFGFTLKTEGEAVEGGVRTTSNSAGM